MILLSASALCYDRIVTFCKWRNQWRTAEKEESHRLIWQTKKRTMEIGKAKEFRIEYINTPIEARKCCKTVNQQKFSARLEHYYCLCLWSNQIKCVIRCSNSRPITPFNISRSTKYDDYYYYSKYPIYLFSFRIECITATAFLSQTIAIVHSMQ